MKKYLYILILAACSKYSTAQYYPLFSQYMFNTLAINPAYAGSREDFCSTALYRNQWTGIEGSPVTQTLSAHTPLKNRQVALGLLIFNDQLGVNGQKGFSAIYAYRLFLNKGILSLGLSGELSVMRSNWPKVKTNDADMVFNESQKFYAPNAGTGIYYYNSLWYAGLSVPRLFTNSYVNNKLKVDHDFSQYNILLTSGILLKAGENLKIKPSTLLKYHNSAGFQYDMNCNFIVNDLVGAGISYRNKNSIVGSLEIYINKQLRIGYSYDYNLTEAQEQTKGSHEFMLQCEFGHKTEAISPRYF